MRRRRVEAGVAGGGLAAWLLARLRRRGSRRVSRLELVERIALGPRQSLALVEAEGVRLLVATSAEGAPAFYRLESGQRCADGGTRAAAKMPVRVSW